MAGLPLDGAMLQGSGGLSLTVGDLGAIISMSPLAALKVSGVEGIITSPTCNRGEYRRVGLPGETGVRDGCAWPEGLSAIGPSLAPSPSGGAVAIATRWGDFPLAYFLRAAGE